ncbi:MAG: nucleotidyltransferase domain-containing protein [Desulfobulbaceae bacterium]|nr:nucleotidyltransferase domain-containing protein [Desulfobulbaceae bacterium]
MPVPLEPYRAYHLQRQDHRKNKNEQKRQRILTSFDTVADITRQFGAKQVFIFGSVLQEKKFNERSDLDILVIGMPLSGWLPALLAIEKILMLSEVTIDLKRAEELPEELIELIIRHGQRVHPKTFGVNETSRISESSIR